MLEASYVLIAARSRIERVRDDFMPRLHDVRRVPVRYQRLLPLSVIRNHQCVILGATSHTLTVGVVERKDEQWLRVLQTLTGAEIFPVLVEPGRMRLLIARIERYQRFHRCYSRAYYVLQLSDQMRHLFLLCENEGL